MPLDIQSWVRGEGSSKDKAPGGEFDPKGFVKDSSGEFDPKAFLKDSSEPQGSTLGDIGRGALQGAGEAAETVGTYLTPGGPTVARAIGRGLSYLDPVRRAQQFIDEPSKSFPQAATRFGVANAPFLAAGPGSVIARPAALIGREVAGRGIPVAVESALARLGIPRTGLAELAALIYGGPEWARSVGFHAGGITGALAERLGLGELARRGRGGSNDEPPGGPPRRDQPPAGEPGPEVATSTRRRGAGDDAAKNQRPQSRWNDPGYFPQTERGGP